MTVVLYLFSSQNDTDTLIKKAAAEFLPAFNGKIFVDEKGKKHISGAYLGVTHSGELTIIALSKSNFGIDCESRLKERNNRGKIIERFFSESEKEYARVDFLRFLEIWTRKEAYVKFTGNGLRELKDADTFSIGGTFYTFEIEQHTVSLYCPQSKKIKLDIKNKLT